MQDAWCKMQDERCKMQDARCKMQDARYFSDVLLLVICLYVSIWFSGKIHKAQIDIKFEMPIDFWYLCKIFLKVYWHYLTYQTLVIGGGDTLKQLGWFVVTSFFFRRVHFRIFFSKAFFFAFWSGSLVTWLTTMERSWFFKSIQNKNNIMFYLLTTGFWGKEAWRPTPKWNTRFFFHFPKELSYGYLRFEGNGKIPLER